MTADGSFGPLIMFGLGGVLTDLLGDRTFAIPPLSGAAADRLIGSIRCAPLLFGYRGSAPVDVASLRDILVRVATLSVEVPEIAELDFNPVIVSPTGAVVVDCKVRVERSQPGPDVLMRALRS
jgi:acyl-CoA synthetase (NDP forming)